MQICENTSKGELIITSTEKINGLDSCVKY